MIFAIAVRSLVFAASVSLLASCVSRIEVPPGNVLVESVREVAQFPLPPGSGARDGGFSVALGGRSFWVFGDTFFSEPAADGFQWRSSSWSAVPLGPGLPESIAQVTHALGADGKPVQLLPHSADELRFNRFHRGETCEAGEDCGARQTPWPMVPIAGPDGSSAVVFYNNMATGLELLDFRSVSGSVAIWNDPNQPARRIEPPLFADEEPDWGTAGLRLGSDVYVYAFETTPQMIGGHCRLARVPFAEVAERSSYRFYAGDGRWGLDWRDSVPVLDCGPLFGVQYNDYLDSFVAFYMRPLTDEMLMRTAPAPEGPWSDALSLGISMRAQRGSWNYALIAHPELAEEGGRIQYLSYTRPTGSLSQEIRILRVAFR